MAVTVIGTVAFDDVKTPFGEIKDGLGGTASHFSMSASFFTDVNMIAVVGDDFPDEHIAMFRDRGINTDGLQVMQGKKTFRWKGHYEYDMNTAHTLETQLNVIENYEPVLPESYKNSRILFLANIDPDQQRAVIDKAGESELVVMDTMNLWINHKKESVIKTLAKVDLLTLNEGEARMLTEQSNLVKAARQLQEWGPKIVVIKQGEYGALLFFGQEIFSAPGLPIDDVNDPTGAGDSFAGGMLGYLDRCERFDYDSMKTAVICGSVMASFNVEKFSCERLKEINFEDIKTRFTEFQGLGKFNNMQIS